MTRKFLRHDTNKVFNLDKILPGTGATWLYFDGEPIITIYIDEYLFKYIDIGEYWLETFYEDLSNPNPSKHLKRYQRTKKIINLI